MTDYQQCKVTKYIYSSQVLFQGTLLKNFHFMLAYCIVLIHCNSEGNIIFTPLYIYLIRFLWKFSLLQSIIKKLIILY